MPNFGDSCVVAPRGGINRGWVEKELAFSHILLYVRNSTGIGSITCYVATMEGKYVLCQF